MKFKILTEKNSTIKHIYFFCPGCDEVHSVRDDVWTVTGEGDKLTIQHSILRTKKYSDDRKNIVCHSFVTEGSIQFLNDCTHELRGKTVKLSDLPDWLGQE